jgi:predicted enzyme related to lactoylglutathione lyase
VALLVFGGCATITPDLPPVTDTPTGNRHGGKVIWHDLLTHTPEASRKFYGELFGWTFENPDLDLGFGPPGSYQLIRSNGILIGGMFDTNLFPERGNISQWITVISVADIDAAVAAAQDEGGKILTPPTQLASRGSIAVIQDSVGALLAVLQTKGGDPADRDPQMNEFLWDELWTSDVADASNFYESVAGYESEDRAFGDAGNTYHLLNAGGKPRAGILQNPFGEVPPVWVNYLRVADPAAIAEKVESLGGKILVAAQARDIGGHAAMIAGPSGAGIALQTWPLR